MLRSKAKKKLSICWAIILVLILIWATIWIITDLFESQTKSILTWITQSVLPYTSLVFTTHLITSKTRDSESIDSIYFNLALFFSVGYGLCILMICAGLCIVKFHNNDPLRIIDNFSILVTVFQTILTGSLGVFFLKEKK